VRGDPQTITDKLEIIHFSSEGAKCLNFLPTTSNRCGDGLFNRVWIIGNGQICGIISRNAEALAASGGRYCYCRRPARETYRSVRAPCLADFPLKSLRKRPICPIRPGCLTGKMRSGRSDSAREAAVWDLVKLESGCQTPKQPLSAIWKRRFRRHETAEGDGFEVMVLLQRRPVLCPQNSKI